MRNIDPAAVVTLTHVDYFDTSGHRVRRYLDQPRTLRPLETAEYWVETGCLGTRPRIGESRWSHFVSCYRIGESMTRAPAQISILLFVAAGGCRPSTTTPARPAAAATRDSASTLMEVPDACSWVLEHDSLGPIGFGGQQFWPSVAEAGDGTVLVSGLRRGTDDVARIHVYGVGNDGTWSQELAVPGTGATLGRDTDGRVQMLVMGVNDDHVPAAQRTWDHVLGSAAYTRTAGRWGTPVSLEKFYFAGRIAPSADGPRAVLVPIGRDGQWHLGGPPAWHPEPLPHSGTADALYPQLAQAQTGSALFWYDGGSRPTVSYGKGKLWALDSPRTASHLGFFDDQPALISPNGGAIALLTPTGTERPLPKTEDTTVVAVPGGGTFDSLAAAASAAGCDSSKGVCDVAYTSVHHSVLDVVPTRGDALAVLLRQTTTASQAGWRCIDGSTGSHCNWQVSSPTVKSTILVGLVGRPLAEVSLPRPMSLRDDGVEATLGRNSRVHIVSPEPAERSGVNDTNIRLTTLRCAETRAARPRS